MATFTIMQTRALFVTQAKGIQDYILGSDKLRDMVGATELVEWLTGQFLTSVLQDFGFTEEKNHYQKISAGAGSARLLFSSIDDAQCLAKIWPLLCAHAAPGLEVLQTVQEIRGSSIIGAIREAEIALALSRSRRDPAFPVAGAAVERTRRSGKPAIAKMYRLPDSELEIIDAETLAKRNRRNTTQRGQLPEIFRRIGFTNEKSDQIPNDFGEVSGSEREYLALIHADGNGLGQLFIALEKHFQEHLEFSSESIIAFYKDLTSAIAAAALESVEAAQLKARDGNDKAILPIVLAGDDLTVIVRADLAMCFISEYLDTFSAKSRESLQKIRQAHGVLKLDTALPEELTAGAGIVFMKHTFPFSSAYRLCESLATYAKNNAKERNKKSPPPSVAFYKITAASIPMEYSELRAHELTGASLSGGIPAMLTMAPYFIGGECLPQLSTLQALVDALMEFPKGPPRELYSLLQTDLARAQKYYGRICDLNSKSKFPACLKELTGEDSPLNSANATPLGDALTLLSFRRKP